MRILKSFILFSSCVFFAVTALSQTAVDNRPSKSIQTTVIDEVVEIRRPFRSFGRKLGLRENFRTLWVDEGLMINKVLTLFLDSRNHMWIGGNGLIARFNGPEIVHYEISGQESDVYGILESKDGKIWFGSYGSGLGYFDGQDFHKVTFDEEFDSTSLLVLDMKMDSRGRIYVATARQGIIVIDKGKYRILSPGDGMNGKIIKAIHLDEEERLWVGYHLKGVSVLDYGVWKHLNVESGLCNDVVNSIDPGAENTVIISTRNGASIVRYDGQFKVIENVLQNRIIAQCAVDHDGNLWFGTKREHGCYVRKNGQWHNYKEQNGLASDRVLAVIPEGRNVWVGSFGKGLTLCGVNLFDHFNSENGLASDR
ncbi:MAG: hypothetical protein HKN32_00570, partial [Flavobacteriales bacterium]|nr:hypothetical protein [Flavobacteriales bacterium]